MYKMLNDFPRLTQTHLTHVTRCGIVIKVRIILTASITTFWDMTSGTHQTSTVEAGICSDTSPSRPAFYKATSYKILCTKLLCCSNFISAYGTKRLHLQEI